MVPLGLLAVLAIASTAGAEEFSAYTATGLPKFLGKRSRYFSNLQGFKPGSIHIPSASVEEMT